MSQEKRKHHWGDRRDARWVKAPGLQTVMGYLLPKRTDCEVYLNDKLDATELVKYLETKTPPIPTIRPPSSIAPSWPWPGWCGSAP